MNWLLIGKSSALANALSSFLPKQSLFFTSRNKSQLDSSTFLLDLSIAENIINFDIPLEPGVAVICISQSKFSFCEQNPDETHRINVTNTINLARKLYSLGWKIVYPSSSAVFSHCSFAKTNDTPNAQTVYGKQKIEVENALLQMENSLIVRITKIISPEFCLFKEWTKSYMDSKILKAFSDYEFAPVGSEQACRVILDLVNHGANGIWHIGACDCISYEKAALQLIKSFQFENKVDLKKVVPQKAQEIIPPEVYFSCTSLDVSLTENFLQMKFLSSVDVIQKWTQGSNCLA